MKTEKAAIEGCFIIHNTVFEDTRGHFFESFNRLEFQKQTGLDINFVQDNQSRSSRHVLRGMHFQTGKDAQAKLVRVLRGAVLDIVVDLRRDAASFGKYFSIELNEENGKQLFIPRGFAHGFLVLSAYADFFYKCDNYYNKEAECGLKFDDETIQIDWQADPSQFIINEKDRQNFSFQQLLKNKMI